MAGKRRTLNRRDLRAAAEAVEGREAETEEAAEEADDEGGDEDGEAKPKKKKPAKPKVVKPKAPKRTRTAKITRMRVVWTVFNNAHQAVARFDYPQKADADALAAKLTGDKKNVHFVQPVKEPMEEKAPTA